MSGTEIDIDWVRTIANETSGKIAGDAQTNTNEFRNSSFEPSAVGTLPVSAAYANQVQAAHAFFTETIQNVIADLNDFATNLRESADAHDDNDGATAAAFNHQAIDDAAIAALSDVDTEYDEQDATDYHSHESNQESAGNEALQVPEEAEQAAQQADEQDSGASAPPAGSQGQDAAPSSGGYS